MSRRTLTKKKRFQFETTYTENGILRNIYHNVTDGDELRRLPFRWFAFDASGEWFVCVDSRGNVFIFDFKQMAFWSFDGIAINCSSVSFAETIVDNNPNVLIGCRDGQIASLDTSTGQIQYKFQAFDHRIHAIALAPQRPDIILCHTNAEILIYCRVGGALCSKHVFNVTSIKSNATNCIKQVLWTRTEPNMLAILCWLSDDSIYVWENAQATNDCASDKLIKTFELRKHIYPVEWRNEWLAKNRKATQDADDENNNYFEKCASDEICAISLLPAEETSQIAVCCADRSCIILDAKQWKLVEVIQMPKCTKQVLATVERTYVASILNHAVETVWAAIDECDRLIFFEINEHRIPPIASLAVAQLTKLQISNNGQLMAAVQNDGQILLLDTEFFLRHALARRTMENPAAVQCDNYNTEMRVINRQLRKMLPQQRMLTILKEYGEYPADYRQIIWKTLLKLPSNSNAFTELLKKGTHPCVQRLDEIYRLRDAKTMHHMKKIMSCLAHWSRVFSIPCDWQTNFLPTFVFPFVKYMPKNSLLAFETIATILLNQCQLWMEFAPLEPINYLGMCENILAHFEPTLMTFYRQQSVTSKLFAWSLARTAFTEALDESQWLQLWDHVVSGPSYFLLFAIVAFNSVHKTAIIRLSIATEVETFFNEPSALDMSKFLKRIYWFMFKCPEHLHPKQYVIEFEPLTSDQYQKFTNYPKQLFDKRTKNADRLRQEMKLICKKYAELERIELAMVDRLGNAMRADEHQRRMRDVEHAYEETLLRELERVEHQRKHLILFERQIYDREMAIRLARIESEQQLVIDQRKSELQSVLNQCERNKICDETDIFAAEEAFRQREMKLFMQNYRKSGDTVATQPLPQQYDTTMTQLANGREKLKSTLQKIVTGRDNTTSPVALSKNKRSIDISIETLEQATNQLEKDVTEMLAQMSQKK